MLAPDGICERCKAGRLHNVAIHRCIKGSLALSTIALTEAILHKMIGSYDACVDRFVVPSRFYIDKFCEWGWPRAMFRHVPNFIEAERYTPEFAPGRDVLYFGRISREKGLVTLIRAAAMTRTRLVIVGTGPQLDELRELAARLAVDVSFPGYLTGEALYAQVRGARAVVLPSEWYENAPMSVLEAYALGKPVLGARIGGIPELLREGETGIGFESADVSSLAGALAKIASLPDAEVEAMGRRARAWVAAEFTDSIYRERISGIYSELGARVSIASRPQTVA